MRRTDIPQFGPLQGVKVVHSSISIAGPFCAQLMADMGADVIWIENPKAPDIARGGGFHQGWSVELNRRNMRSMALDIPSEKGREVFLKMLAATDIFIEASKGGQYDRWGLSDKELWRANPALVIVHISRLWPGGRRLLRVPGVLRSYRPGVRRVDVRQFPSWYGAIPFLPRCGRRLLGLFGSGWRAGRPVPRARNRAGESVDIAQYEAVLRSQGQEHDGRAQYGQPHFPYAVPQRRVGGGLRGLRVLRWQALRGDDARSGRVQERHGGARAALRDRRDSRRLGAFVSQYARREDD